MIFCLFVCRQRKFFLFLFFFFYRSFGLFSFPLSVPIICFYFYFYFFFSAYRIFFFGFCVLFFTESVLFPFGIETMDGCGREYCRRDRCRNYREPFRLISTATAAAEFRHSASILQGPRKLNASREEDFSFWADRGLA